METAYLVWAVLISIAVHNVEEALYLPAWARDRSVRWSRPVQDGPFRFAVLVLTSIVLGAAIWTRVAGPGSLAHHVLGAFALGQMLNVLFPHISMTIVNRRYMPGLATGVLLVLPACGAFLIDGISIGTLAPRTLLVVSALVVPLTIASIPLLFRLGRLIVSQRRSRASASDDEAYSD